MSARAKPPTMPNSPDRGRSHRAKQAQKLRRHDRCTGCIDTVSGPHSSENVIFLFECPTTCYERTSTLAGTSGRFAFALLGARSEPPPLLDYIGTFSKIKSQDQVLWTHVSNSQR